MIGSTMLLAGQATLIAPPAHAEAARMSDPGVEFIELSLADAAPPGLEWLWASVREWLARANRDYQEQVANPLRTPPPPEPSTTAEPAPLPPSAPATTAAVPDKQPLAPPEPAGGLAENAGATANDTEQRHASPAPSDETQSVEPIRRAEEAARAAEEARRAAELVREDERSAAAALEAEAALATTQAEQTAKDAERRMIEEAEASAAEALDTAYARLAEERRAAEARAARELRAEERRQAAALARATEERLAEGRRADANARERRTTTPESRKTRVALAARSASSERSKGVRPLSPTVKATRGQPRPEGRQVASGFRAKSKVRLAKNCANGKCRTKRVARVHVVKSGETLSRIAWTHYRSARRYVELERANRSKIKNPDLIYPGQKLMIPGLSRRG